MSQKYKPGRNDPCPCGSGKKFKKCCGIQSKIVPTNDFTWQDKEGVHVVSKGTPPTKEELIQLTKEYQDNIRKSPLWTEMVNTYGIEKAEEMLLQFEAKIAP